MVAPAAADVHYIAADITTARGCGLVAQDALAHVGGIDILHPPSVLLLVAPTRAARSFTNWRNPARQSRLKLL
jgi:hypothetical protein